MREIGESYTYRKTTEIEGVFKDIKTEIEREKNR